MSTEDPVPTPVVTRDSARAAIFAARKAAVREITFFGVPIEIRQPYLEDILNSQTYSEDSAGSVSIIIDILVKYAYLPDSDTHIFEVTDADMIKKMPFGEDFQAVMKAFQELSGINFQSGTSTSGSTQED